MRAAHRGSLFCSERFAQMATQPAGEHSSLKRTLGPWSLTAMGIGCIIGTGIFVLTGIASATRAGPALTISFVIAGAACALAALCYAEVSSKIPIAGSAYTYTYATFGEFFGWIVGWSLALEYSLAAASVAVGWSAYLATILRDVAHVAVSPAWVHSHWDPVQGIVNVPAVAIVALVTMILVRGTKESSVLNTIVVALKVLVILLFIAVGAGHINPMNYHLPPGPATHAGGFIPFGWHGILGGAAFMAFAYFGFDALSTAAEEARNPRRDVPFAIIASLVACTVLYLVVVAVLNGMVPFNELNVPNAVAFALDRVGYPWAASLVSFGAIAGLTTGLLVLMFAQSRVFFAMSRDGLVPSAFTAIHPVWRTPVFSQVFFGVLIACAAGLFPINVIASLANMGTLVAFIATSLAVPVLRAKRPDIESGFSVPGGPYVIPILSAVASAGLIYYLQAGNPLVWGRVPIVWFGFGVWLAAGLLFYAAYGRRRRARLAYS